MLRINLLPPYIYDDQKKKTWIAVMGLVCLGAIGAGAFMVMQANAAKDEAQKLNDTAKELQGTHDGLVTKIKGVEDKVAVTKQKRDFVADSRTYNTAWPGLYEEIRNLTSSKVVLDSMRMTTADTVQITGFSPTELDVAQWWAELKKHPKFSLVQFDLPAHPFPGTGGTGNNASLATFGGGAGGGAKNIPGPFSATGGGGGAPTGMAAMSGMMMGGMGRGGATGGGGGGGNTQVGPTVLEGRPGIAFVGRITLVKQFADGKPVPAWPARGGSSGGSGGFGGGGAGGAMSSMMTGGGMQMMSGMSPVASGGGK